MALLRRMNRLEKARRPRLAVVASLLFATACLAISAHAVHVGRFSNQEYQGT